MIGAVVVLMAAGMAVLLARRFTTGAVTYLAIVPIIPITLSLDAGVALPILSLSRLLLVMVLVMFSWQVLTRQLPLEPMPLRGAFAFFLVGLVAANLFSIERNTAGWFRIFSFIVEEIAVFTVAWHVLREPVQRLWFLRALTAAVTLALLFAAFELVSGTNPVVEAGLAMRENLIYDYTLDLRFGYRRLQSLFRNPLDFGVYLSLAVPVVWAYGRQSKVRLERQITAVVAAAGLVAALLTFSRTAIYSLIVIGIAYLLLIRKWKPLAAAAAGIALVVVVLVNVMGVPLREYVYLSAVAPDQVSGDVSGSSLLSFARISSNHLKLWQEAPIYGRGVGTLPPNPAGQGLDPFDVGLGEQGLTYLLVETGLIGLAAFLSIFLVAGRRLWGGTASWNTPDVRRISTALLAVLTGYMASIELAGRWHFPFVLVLMALGMRLAARTMAVRPARAAEPGTAMAPAANPFVLPGASPVD